MTTTISAYDQQAIDLLNKLGVTFSAKYLTHDFHFEDDRETRDIYRLTLSRGKERISFKFGQSIYGSNKGEIPSAYDLLSCIQKNDPGSFNNFCSDFGYDEDSRKAYSVYKGVVKEWEKVERFFTPDEIEELCEIN